MIFKVTFALSILLLLSGCSHKAHSGQDLFSQDNSLSLKVDQLAQFDDIPWGIDFLDDNTLLITLKRGRLVRLDLRTLKSQQIDGLPKVDPTGQGGLLDVAVPKGPRPAWIYFTYSKPSYRGAATALGRARLDNGRLINWQTLFVANNISHSGKHFGSRIAFDQSGHVFISVGERGERENAQNVRMHGGKILRLHTDGRIPGDNPLIPHALTRHAIWSYGHRNPQGLFFDPTTNTLWSNEHGPRGGDEINLIHPGANYGWPVVSHGKEYWGPVPIGEGTYKEGMMPPEKVFTPSIAPGDMIRYQGTLFPDWQGDFISTALAKRHLNRVRLKPGATPVETRYLTRLKERMRSIAEAPDGALIISTDSGKILRVTPDLPKTPD